MNNAAVSENNSIWPIPVGMSASLVFLFALAGGVAVSNLYWAQPLLSEIAQSYRVGEGAAGALVTATQIGYAIGVFLIVPLGDVVNRRRLIPGVMYCSSVALVASAIAPNFTALVVCLTAVGLTTVTGQLLTPLAGDLVQPEHRGRVVGTVVSGILMGILLSRTISGLLGDLFGWRSVYWLAAAITAIAATILANRLPLEHSRPKIPYWKLLTSVIDVIRQYRAVRVTLILGATVFCVFTMFWTGLTFLLNAPPFSYSLTQIGLVGLVGLAGALTAQRSGIIHDRGWAVSATGVGLLVSLVSVAIAAVSMGSIIGIMVSTLLLNAVIQSVNVLNQIRIFAVDPAKRSRLNTAFVAGNFIGGAFGSALAGLLWEVDGWTAIMLGAGSLLTFALIIWALFRKALDAR